VQPYIEREVPEDLRPAVTRMWWLCMPSPQRYERIVPIPAVHLIVNLSAEPYRVLRRGDETVGDTFPAAFLSGLQLDYLVNENPAEIHHVGAELAPWALPAFGVDPVGAAQRVQDAGGPFPGSAAVDSLDALEGLLRSRLDPRWVPDPRILTAVESIITHPERPIAGVAESAGLTPKGFIALFRRHTGVTPKRFAEVCRHHDFLQQLPTAGELPTWTELLAHARYYDQPAFIREFRRFTGMTPTAYLDQRQRYGPGDPSFLPLDDAG
jgi:AraC-like DNA-binding protein